MLRRFATLSLVASLALLGAAACQQQGGGEPGGAAKVFDVEAKEFSFTPPTWEVDAGQEFTISMNNTGSQVHNWVLLDPATDPATVTEENQAEYELASLRAEPAQSGSGTFTAPAEAGDYPVICSVAGHLAAGMKGTLTVK
jgi:plastocyanin